MTDSAPAPASGGLLPGYYLATQADYRPGIVEYVNDGRSSAHWRNANDNRMADPRDLGFTVRPIASLLRPVPAAPGGVHPLDPHDGDIVDCPTCKGSGRVVHDENPPAEDFLDDLTAEMTGANPSADQYIANMQMGARIVQFFCIRGWTPPMEAVPPAPPAAGVSEALMDVAWKSALAEDANTGGYGEALVCLTRNELRTVITAALAAKGTP